MSKIIYTYTDEAPMLATYSLLPLFQRFAKPMGIEVRNHNDLEWTGLVRFLLLYLPNLSLSQTATLNTCVSAGLLPREGALWNGYFPEFNSRLFSTT